MTANISVTATKGKVCGWGWMMSWLLGSAANSDRLHLTSWPSWPSMLEVSKYVIVSIASGMCRKIKSGHCRSLQTKRTQSQYWHDTVQSHKHEAILWKNSLSVRMPIMSKWPILHLLLLLVQQTLQPQRHTAGTKPQDKSYNRRTTFWQCKSLVSRHGSSQERYQFCIVRSIVYHLCIQPSCDNLPLLTVGIRGYRRIATENLLQVTWFLLKCDWSCQDVPHAQHERPPFEDQWQCCPPRDYLRVANHP